MKVLESENVSRKIMMNMMPPSNWDELVYKWKPHKGDLIELPTEVVKNE